MPAQWSSGSSRTHSSYRPGSSRRISDRPPRNRTTPPLPASSWGRLDALRSLLEHVDRRLDAVAAAAEANVSTSDQLGVLQAQMIEVRSQLNLPWRAEGADERPDEPDSMQRASTS
jgi:hypothetical protein